MSTTSHGAKGRGRRPFLSSLFAYSISWSAGPRDSHTADGMALESEDWEDRFGTSAEFSDDQSGYGLTWKADIGWHIVMDERGRSTSRRNSMCRRGAGMKERGAFGSSQRK